MRAIITGGAGFIGSTLADFLLAKGWHVTAIDNMSAGREEFYAHNLGNPSYRFAQLDLKDARKVKDAFAQGADVVFHLAANADVKGGADHPTLDLHEGCMATSNVLEAMRAAGIGKIVFSSTGSVYGEPEVFPTPEDAPFPVQTSMYAASKLYAEGLISAYCEAYGMQAWIYRFVSILGERYTHGVVFSFCAQLRKEDRLTFLSDGTPRKSYLYVGDCVAGIWHGLQHAKGKVNILNLGNDEEMPVRDIADIVVRESGRKKGEIEYVLGQTQRGWIGDSPHIRLDIARMRKLGWEPALSIEQAIVRTVRWLEANPWALEGKYFRGKG